MSTDNQIEQWILRNGGLSTREELDQWVAEVEELLEWIIAVEIRLTEQGLRDRVNRK